MDTLRWDDHFFDHIDIPDRLDKHMLIDTIVERSGACTPIYADPSLFHHYMVMWFKTNKPIFEKMIDTTLFEYNPIENYDRREWYKDVHDYDVVDGKNTTQFTDSSGEQNGTGNITNNGTTDNTSNTTSDSTKNITSDVSTTQDSTVTDNNTTKLSSNSTEDNVLHVYPFDSNLSQPKDERNITNGKNDNTTYDGTVKSDIDGTEHTVSKEIDNSTGKIIDHGTTLNTSDSTEHNESKSSVGSIGEENSKRDDTGTFEHEAYIHGNIGVTTTQAMIAEERAIILYNVYENISDMFEDRFMLIVY